MWANRPEPSGTDKKDISPSQQLRDMFRLPRRGAVRNANDNPAPLGWLLKKTVLTALPLLALGFLAAAVFLGSR